MSGDLDTGQIKHWRSIVTLVVFVLTNIIVLHPFHIPVFIPRPLWHWTLDALSAVRIIAPRQQHQQQQQQQEQSHRPGPHHHHHHHEGDGEAAAVVAAKPGYFVRFRFPLNFVTAPLIADLFLLAILAIGREEVHDGTIGANNISPIDVMVFFITLAYIAISIDASGLIRYLAFKVLQWGGEVGHRLFFYLYAFFFCLGSFIGNDPIILSGTAFLAYMTRVSSNIVHPRAWIHTQFAVANIASAILVSSNPTNLVLAGAFDIKFIVYTANMVVPVVVTGIVLFPFLLYIVFANESLIPLSIKMHDLPDEVKAKKPVNPNIPHARGDIDEAANDLANNEQGKLLSLEEIMNPFLDKGGAAFGAVIMTATLVTLLALNAASTGSGAHAVYWVTLPAAFVMFCWDVAFGWVHRHETRDIARKGREAIERARAERAMREEEAALETPLQDMAPATAAPSSPQGGRRRRHRPEPTTESDISDDPDCAVISDDGTSSETDPRPPRRRASSRPAPVLLVSEEKDAALELEWEDQRTATARSGGAAGNAVREERQPQAGEMVISTPQGLLGAPLTSKEAALEESKQEDSADLERRISQEVALRQTRGQTTLVSLTADGYRWLQETFPTVTAVVGHLPFALVPFAFAMFVLVQALVTKGWVPVFAYGWDHWVRKTGTFGCIGGMGFLSVILCNFAGTNIGTTILLSRVIQAWVEIRRHDPITDRNFWATVYSMALGVNFGAFSTAFSASLAGLLWRDILARKHIRVRSLEFARVNLPIIAIAMTVGCAVLAAEVYIVRHKDRFYTPYAA